MKVVAIVLTLNEGRHLRRCLRSLKDVVDEVLVADCFSTDDTGQIAVEHGSKFVQHAWMNHSTQFNWALSQLNQDTDWVLRVDADEYVTPELAAEIRTELPALGDHIEGVYCNRRMVFQGRLIRFGGVYPIRVLRLFRFACGRCENRWMDEHIKVAGPTVNFHGDIIDHNLNSLTWWTSKHNNYASREAVDLLNLRFGFMPVDSVAGLRMGSPPAVKRWVKESVYLRLPAEFRAFAYFFYRYVMRFGFLDGRAGILFHVLQGFWYRYLVDAKIGEVRRYMKDHQCDVSTAIERVLEIKLQSQTTHSGRG